MGLEHLGVRQQFANIKAYSIAERAVRTCKIRTDRVWITVLTDEAAERVLDQFRT